MIAVAEATARVSNPLADRRNTKGMATAIPFVFGRDDRIRTCDFYVPNVALYQTEPHPENQHNYYKGRQYFCQLHYAQNKGTQFMSVCLFSLYEAEV